MYFLRAFPPKAGSELQNALKIVDKIAEIKPHFMSVTYGAGGTSAGQTVAIAKAVEEHNIPRAGAFNLH